ncbi:unnamed protein product [Oikopleura dioica]|uniref:SMB domain-containing protein n=1 Tax=Oikopleura dioica TaxID=34765 RepID=E4X618_OIKDI|nr:unnamed protein product [Oikopleura dioica]
MRKTGFLIAIWFLVFIFSGVAVYKLLEEKSAEVKIFIWTTEQTREVVSTTKTSTTTTTTTITTTTTSTSPSTTTTTTSTTTTTTTTKPSVCKGWDVPSICCGSGNVASSCRRSGCWCDRICCQFNDCCHDYDEGECAAEHGPCSANSKSNYNQTIKTRDNF